MVVQNPSYPYSDIVTLAMTLVYKDVSCISLKQAAVIKFLKAVATELENGTGKKQTNTPTINWALFENSHPNVFQSNQDPKIQRSATLLDLYAEHAAEYNFNTSGFTSAKGEPVTESTQEILDSLVDEDNESHVNLVKGNALSYAIERFLKALLKARGIIVETIEDLIKKAKTQQEAFIKGTSV